MPCRAVRDILVRSVLPARDCKHNHIKHLAGVGRISGRKHHLDDEQTTIWLHLAATVAKDCQALGFVPIVDDMREQVGATAGGDAFEETATFNLNAIGQSLCLDQRRGVANDVWQVQEYPTRLGMQAKDGGEHLTGCAANVDERLTLGKVICRGHRGRFPCMKANHGFAEHGRLGRMVSQPFEQWHAEDFLESGLSGLDRIIQLAH